MRFVYSIVVMALSATALAQSQHGSKEEQEDAKRHRTLAAAHEAAARCLEAGKGVKACLEQLRKDCKGTGIGKYCGMKHTH
jgi:Ni/Co efflux regulator RcnB